jgi:hypothetical protein
MTTETGKAQFLKLVAKMRRLQQQYFNGRSRLVLGEAKAAEREVDAEIARLEPLISVYENNARHFSNCQLLGDLFLSFGGEKFEMGSTITPHLRREDDLNSFEVVNSDNTTRYRIVFKVEEM